MTREARDVYVDPAYVVDAEARGRDDRRGARSARRARCRRPSRPTARSSRSIDRSTSTLAEELEELALPGIGFLEVAKRYYPAGALAPQVLGFVNIDGDGRGRARGAYDEMLAGTPGERTIELSADGLPISNGLDASVPPVPGSTMHTTIDRQMQYMVQAALERAVKANGALGGTAVVMDPATGEVLAMATYPWFDPNAYSEAPLEAMRNRAVTDCVRAGLGEQDHHRGRGARDGRGLARRALPRAGHDGGRSVHDPDSHAHPVESMTIGDIITESSNIGAALIAEQVGSVHARVRSCSGSATDARPGSGSPARRRVRCCPATSGTR